MTSLQVLNVAFNQLTGNFPPGLCELVLLRELYIDNNDLRGSLPLCLENLTSLRVLDVSYNQLTENISSSPLTHLTSMEKLILSNNHFQIPISLEPLFNLSKLKTFIGDNDANSLPLEISNIGCLQQFLSRPYPSRNQNISASLMHLNLSRNAFSGSIPSSFADMKMLKSLDISYNQLTGAIPERMAMGCFSLEILALSNNSLQGHIFSKKFNLTNLKRLQLDGNKFTGEIPESLSKCYLLGGLYLSDNHLFSKIPRWLGSLLALQDIIMPNNNLDSGRTNSKRVLSA
ncbi:hypothetical protein WN943_025936 [Citrus x changshan-huyou]